MEMIDVVGRPLHEAEDLLKKAGIAYDVEMTSPTRHIFSVDNTRLYVVRQIAALAEGRIHILAAAKQRKEVS